MHYVRRGFVDEWMDGWMNACMHACEGEWMGGCEYVDLEMSHLTHKLIKCMHEFILTAYGSQSPKRIMLRGIVGIDLA